MIMEIYISLQMKFKLYFFMLNNYFPGRAAILIKGPSGTVVITLQFSDLLPKK